MLIRKPKKQCYRCISVLDSIGKMGFNGGISYGNLAAYGSFEECVNIQTEEESFTISGYPYTQPAFQGQYLMAKLIPVPYINNETNVNETEFSVNPDLRHQDYGFPGTGNAFFDDVFQVIYFDSFFVKGIKIFRRHDSHYHRRKTITIQ